MRIFTPITRNAALCVLSLMTGLSATTAQGSEAVPSRPVAPVAAERPVVQPLPVKAMPGRLAAAAAVPVKSPVKAAPITTLPFEDNFSDGELTRSRYTVVDVDNDGSGEGNAVKNCWFWKEDEQLIQFCTDNAVGNDWLISPAIHLDGKNIYNVEIVVNMGAKSNLRLTLGTSPDPSTHTEILDLPGLEGTWQTAHNTDFSVPCEGDYYIGIYNYNDKNSFYLNLFSLKVTAGIDSDIPAAPTDLTVTPASNGAASAELSFTVPDKYANGDVIDGTLDLYVYRNENVAHQAKGTAGTLFKWTDNNPDKGENVYKVYASYGNKDGIMAEKTTWVGPDLPQTPKFTVFRTTGKNMKVSLEWTPADKGAHSDQGYYYDPSQVTYTVYRGIKSNEMIAIGENLTSTTFVDDFSNLPEMAEAHKQGQFSYFYAVSASNSTGESKSGADIIAVGKPYELPQYESFADGQLNLRPWLTDPITGSFSWSASRGEYAQDGDNGYTKFQNDWGGNADSRLISPVFDISGSENPMVSFYMYHWLASQVEADNGATRMYLEVSRDGGPFERLCEDIPAGYELSGWVEHRISLKDYKDSETVQFGFRGLTDNGWMYFFIDNFHFEEQQANDLAVDSFYGTTGLNIDGEGAYRVNYLNRGTKTAAGYTVDFYKDGKLIESAPGTSLEPGETASVAFTYTFNAADVDTPNEFSVELNYQADGNSTNNKSQTVRTSVRPSYYPTVDGLSASEEDGTAVISWNAPELPSGDPVVDGAEDYESFVINDFGQWISYDGDQKLSGRDINLPNWPNSEINQAFIVWAPTELEGFDSENYANYLPYEGTKCFLVWLANLWDWDTFEPPTNDDWLISPEVSGGTQLSFMVKGISDIDLEDETYQIMYSASGTDISDFTVLKDGVAKAQWEEVKVDLPADANYFAIHYNATDQMGIMVDNVSYVPVTSSLKIQGYNVFRNGQKLNGELVKTTTYTDNELPDGDVVYRVAAVYDRGTSNASEPYSLVRSGVSGLGHEVCTVRVVAGTLMVTAPESVQLRVYGIDGKAVMNTTVNGTESYTLPGGFYIVEIGGRTFKVAI